MKNLKWKLQNFMMGRNGMDDCAKYSYIAGIVLYVIYLFTGVGFLYYFSTLLLLYGLFRVFSKNVAARQSEERKLHDEINFQKMRFEQRKEYRLYRCKGCGRKIRVPKGKGKVEVTCPTCGNKEIHRT